MFKSNLLTYISAIAILVLAGCSADGSTGEPQDETISSLETDSISAVPSPTQGPLPPTQNSNSSANADVKFVRAVQAVDGSWTFYVTVEHPDTGWEDYADGWDVVTPDGEVIKPDPDSQFTRLLLHPHVEEQPFIRSQSGIVIPDGVNWVTVRAHDSVDGFGGQEVVVDLRTDSGEDFEIESNR